MRRSNAPILAVGLAAMLFTSGSVVVAPQVVAAQVVAAPSAFVRVNQLGYPDRGPKVAYLLSTRPETGAVARVADRRGRVVAIASISADRGRWNSEYAHVYAISFSSFRMHGRYHIVVDGPAAAASPHFAVAAASDVYRAALRNARRFYENQRDGPEFIASSLRTAPAHLNDEHAMTYRPIATNANDGFAGDLSPLGTRIDAAGGWFDAGDYLKFVETTSYVDVMLLTGVIEFPRQLGSGSSDADLRGEARFGLDWLSKMWDPKTETLYYQVGIGTGNAHTSGDHDIWRLPQADDSWAGSDPIYRYVRNRPVFRAGPPGSAISPNLAGRLAAAFALGAIAFRHSDPPYAGSLLHNAEVIFGLADTSPGGRLRTVLPYGFYPETSWHDDLELGATEIARALQAGVPSRGSDEHDVRFYLQRAAEWARATLHDSARQAEPLNLYDVSGLAHYDLFRALGRGVTAGLDVSRNQLRAAVDAELVVAIRQSAHDAFGFGWAWDGSDTVSHGAGLSVMASMYDAMSHSARYEREAQGWLDNILGADAWGVSFIVGDGTTFPNCMQHQIANIVGSLDGRPPVLAGAAVEGPTDATSRGTLPNMRPCPPEGGDAYAPFDNAAKYRDNVQSYTTDEPALDLGASSILAFAWRASS